MIIFWLSSKVSIIDIFQIPGISSKQILKAATETLKQDVKYAES